MIIIGTINQELPGLDTTPCSRSPIAMPVDQANAYQAALYCGCMLVADPIFNWKQIKKVLDDIASPAIAIASGHAVSLIKKSSASNAGAPALSSSSSDIRPWPQRTTTDAVKI